MGKSSFFFGIRVGAPEARRLTHLRMDSHINLQPAERYQESGFHLKLCFISDPRLNDLRSEDALRNSNSPTVIDLCTGILDEFSLPKITELEVTHLAQFEDNGTIYAGCSPSSTARFQDLAKTLGYGLAAADIEYAQEYFPPTPHISLGKKGYEVLKGELPLPQTVVIPVQRIELLTNFGSPGRRTYRTLHSTTPVPLRE